MTPAIISDINSFRQSGSGLLLAADWDHESSLSIETSLLLSATNLVWLNLRLIRFVFVLQTQLCQRAIIHNRR